MNTNEHWYENSIKIDYGKDALFDEYAKKLLKDYYLLPGEDSPQQALARAALAYCEGDRDFAQRIYGYSSDHWFMHSSPCLSNAPRVGETPRTLPISCYLQYVPNSLTGLIDHTTEERWLTVKGGGIGAHWSSVQSVGSRMNSGGEHPGMMGFLHTHDADMLAYRQGDTRRGSYAAFLHVSHPEIVEFIGMRVPTGDVNKKNRNLHHGVLITDRFLEAVAKNELWALIDPQTREVMDELPARTLWQAILTTRYRTGEPYIIQIDEANRQLNPYQKALGLEINGSNLCTEIYLPTSPDRTAVCCLASVNLAKYDEWKDHPLFIADMVRLLDNVLEVFIRHAPPQLGKAVNSARKERSIGLGAMGWHTFLTDRLIPWDSALALSWNRRIFRQIREQAELATRNLAVERGCPEDLQGSGRRNAHLMAIAPNANSSVILGVSPSIEPEPGVAYVRETRAGTGFYRNRAFARLLEDVYPEFNTDATWRSIIAAEGSVQGLEWLSEEHKRVFRTAYEIDQHVVVRHARARQEFIDQGQSVNLFFPKNAKKIYLHSVHNSAFSTTEEFQPLKGLYYLRTESSVTADKIGVKYERSALKDAACVACEG